MKSRRSLDRRSHPNQIRRMDKRALQHNLAWQLLARLERLSADSPWAHQASGVRGALLRSLQTEEASGRGKDASPGSDDLQALIECGFMILEKAAREMNRKV